VVGNPWSDVVKALNGKLNVGLMDKPTGSVAPKLIVNSDVSKAFSVANGVTQYDSYTAKLTSLNADGYLTAKAAGDIKTINAYGIKKATVGDTTAYSYNNDGYNVANDFMVSVKGLMNGSATEFAAGEYVVEDSLGLFDTTGAWTIDWDAQKELEKLYENAEDVISVYVPAETDPVAQFTVTFSKDEPAAASIDTVYKLNGVVGFKNGEINTTDIYEGLFAVRDQYGAYQTVFDAPAVTLNGVTDDGSYRPQKTGDVENWIVGYNGRTEFYLKDNPEAAGRIVPDNNLQATVTFGDFSSDVVLNVVNWADVYVLSDYYQVAGAIVDATYGRLPLTTTNGSTVTLTKVEGNDIITLNGRNKGNVSTWNNRGAVEIFKVEVSMDGATQTPSGTFQLTRANNNWGYTVVPYVTDEE
jgi:hypothetical protein